MFSLVQSIDLYSPYKGLKGFAQLRAAQTILSYATSNFKNCLLYVQVVDKNKCYEDH